MRTLQTAVASMTLLAALFTGTGCGEVLFAQADAPRACVTVPDQKVEGTDTQGHSVTIHTRQAFKIDEAALKPPDGSDYSVELVSVTFAGKSGADFSFVEKAAVSSAASMDANAPMQPLFSYSKKALTQKGTLALEPQTPVDITGAMQAGLVYIDTAITGVPPKTSFKTDVTACFAVSARTYYAR